jgi:hypothetical protein
MRHVGFTDHHKRITKRSPMLDVLSVLLAAESVSMIAFAIVYYRQLREARGEYEKARNAVGDIVLSFNRELKREAQRLELVAYRIEEVASKEDRTLKKGEDLERRVSVLQSQRNYQQDLDALAMKVEDTDRKLSDVMASQQTLMGKITLVENQTKQFGFLPETATEAIIPIRRDKAIAQLTVTELAALEFLVSSGAKTAPEIREQVRLSREHTARLMKKLYEEGYLDRDTIKIPFKYSVKKEMEKILKKAENEAATDS